MGGLSTALLIGVGGLDAAQGALDATSNNIANVNTPGYTREVAQFSEVPENDSNSQITGGGVTLDGLMSIRDVLEFRLETLSEQDGGRHNDAAPLSNSTNNVASPT